MKKSVLFLTICMLFSCIMAVNTKASTTYKEEIISNVSGKLEEKLNENVVVYRNLQNIEDVLMNDEEKIYFSISRALHLVVPWMFG